MQRGVLQALNPLSIHVTLTAIVPGAYPGETKMCLRLIAKVLIKDLWYKSLYSDHN